MKVLLSLIALAIFCACTAPVVTSKPAKTLVVASDFLTYKDSLLFKDFTQKSGVKVYIKTMTKDSILSHFNYYKFSSQFDLVVLNSIGSLHHLEEKGVFHPLPDDIARDFESYISKGRSWVVLGFDPYVIKGTAQTFQYNELTYGKKWYSQLQENEMAAFYASTVFQFGNRNQAKAAEWLIKLEDHMATKRDSLSANFEFTRLSKLKKDSSTIVYPNQNKRFGSIYDVVGIGMIRHSSNYTACVDFVHFYTVMANNQRMTWRLNILPMKNPEGHSQHTYQNNYPILYRATAKQLAPSFGTIASLKQQMKSLRETKKVVVRPQVETAINDSI